jgi:hypothetical protein
MSTFTKLSTVLSFIDTATIEEIIALQTACRTRTDELNEQSKSKLKVGDIVSTALKHPTNGRILKIGRKWADIRGNDNRLYSVNLSVLTPIM